MLSICTWFTKDGRSGYIVNRLTKTIYTLSI